MSTAAEPTAAPVESALPLTPDDLLRMPDGVRYELVDGRLQEKAMGFLSQFVGTRMARLLGNFCEPDGVAYVVSETGYTCFPEKSGQMRRPDVSVVLTPRVTPEMLEQGYLRIAPDIAVEVVSPHDTVYDLGDCPSIAFSP